MKNKKIYGLIAVSLMSTLLLTACATNNGGDTKGSDKTEQSSSSKDKEVKTDDGYGEFYIGKGGVVDKKDINADLPVLTVYFDPGCIWCKVFEDKTADYLNKEVEDGNIYVKYVPLMFLNDGNQGFSATSASFILGSTKFAPELTQEFIQALFKAQPDEGVVSTKSWQPEDIAKIFKEIGGTDEQLKNIESVYDENLTVTFEKTKASMSSEELNRAGGEGFFFTPFVIPQKKETDKKEALSFADENDMLVKTKKAVEGIKSK